MTWKLYKKLISQSIQENLTYRSTSVIIIIFNIIFFMTEVIVGIVLFNNTTLLGGWTKHQYFLLIGVSTLINSLYQLLFIVSHENLADNILDGELDHIFLKPVNSFYYYAFNRIDPPSIINVILSICLISFYMPDTNAFNFVLFIISIIFSVWFIFLINQIIVTFAFWIDKGGKFMALPEYLSDIASKPSSIYPKILVRLLTWIFPFFLAFNTPVLILNYDTQIYRVCYFILFVILLHFFTITFWKKGLKKYQSSN